MLYFLRRLLFGSSSWLFANQIFQTPPKYHLILCLFQVILFRVAVLIFRTYRYGNAGLDVSWGQHKGINILPETFSVGIFAIPLSCTVYQLSHPITSNGKFYNQVLIFILQDQIPRGPPAGNCLGEVRGGRLCKMLCCQLRK